MEDECHTFSESQDRDLGFSGETQYYDDNEDEDEEVKEDNYDNKEDRKVYNEPNYQVSYLFGITSLS